jgi:hypothetical protein
VIPEQDRGAGAENVFFVGDEGIAVLTFCPFPLGETVQVIIADHCFFEYD